MPRKSKTKKPFNPVEFALRVLRAASKKNPAWYAAVHRATRAFSLIECATCQGHFPRKEIQIDHIDPFIPLSGFDNDFTGMVTRLYCSADGLQALCIPCHKLKSKQEMGIRAQHRKAKKNEEV